ncbi:copper resistance protein NlpE [Polaribacter uvawellassae]|uniref:copper resistance protein NlpE n=1 Tax=Polaribacter uvawellassae TaxID=3133495 RepID=UPI00321A69E7
MKKAIGVLLLISVVFMSCKTTKTESVVGVYKGMFPCADCEGIDNILTLNEDKTFVLETIYLGKEGAKTFTNKGYYKVDDKQLRLLDKSAFKYQIEDDYLELLDISGNKIESQLNYKLIKQK